MAENEETTLVLADRPPEGSRAARRLRREGLVPGVLYGAGDQPFSFSVDGRLLRNTLARSGSILRVNVAGGEVPVLVKDVQRHPVRGNAMHVDFLRVSLDEKVHATATLHLVGADVAAGVKEGGVLSQELIQLSVEALPDSLPDAIEYDVSELQINETVTLSQITAPRGVTLLDDPETTVVTITPPTVEPLDTDIEVETERVGEAQAEGDTEEEARESETSSDAS